MKAKDQIKVSGKIYKTQKGSVFLEVGEGDLDKVLGQLQAKGITRISCISGYDSGKEIEIIYHFPYEKGMLNVKTRIDRKRPKIFSITDRYPGAELFERELAEMLGIKITGHPDMRKLFLDRTSPKAPLRRKK